MRNINLSSKVAIVTGGGASIGAAITTALNEAGASVVIAQRSEPGDAVARQWNDRVIYQKTDITSDAQLDVLVQTAVDRFGGIDFVVNNSAIAEEQGYSSSRAQWQRMLDVNVISSALLVQKALPYLQKSDLPAVVNISSCTAHCGVDLLLAYPVSKAAVSSLTRGLAAQLSAMGIRVNAVAPGATQSKPITELVGGDVALADRAVAHAQPLYGGRLVSAEEVADAVLFLCSDLAKFITGTVVPVDGGYAALGPENMTASIYGRLTEMMLKG